MNISSPQIGGNARRFIVSVLLAFGGCSPQAGSRQRRAGHTGSPNTYGNTDRRGDCVIRKSLTGDMVMRERKIVSPPQIFHIPRKCAAMAEKGVFWSIPANCCRPYIRPRIASLLTPLPAATPWPRRQRSVLIFLFLFGKATMPRQLGMATVKILG